MLPLENDVISLNIETAFTVVSLDKEYLTLQTQNSLQTSLCMDLYLYGAIALFTKELDPLPSYTSCLVSFLESTPKGNMLSKTVIHHLTYLPSSFLGCCRFNGEDPSSATAGKRPEQ